MLNADCHLSACTFAANGAGPGPPGPASRPGRAGATALPRLCGGRELVLHTGVDTVEGALLRALFWGSAHARAISGRTPLATCGPWSGSVLGLEPVARATHAPMRRLNRGPRHSAPRAREDWAVPGRVRDAFEASLRSADLIVKSVGASETPHERLTRAGKAHIARSNRTAPPHRRAFARCTRATSRRCSGRCAWTAAR